MKQKWAKRSKLSISESPANSNQQCRLQCDRDEDILNDSDENVILVVAQDPPLQSRCAPSLRGRVRLQDQTLVTDYPNSSGPQSFSTSGVSGDMCRSKKQRYTIRCSC